MDESENSAQQGSNGGTVTINSLIADLGSKDGLVRVRARRSLVAIGGQVVGPLAKALASKISKACYYIMRDQVDFDVKKMFG